MLGCVDNFLRPVGGPNEKSLVFTKTSFQKVGREETVLIRKIFSACSLQFKMVENPVMWIFAGLEKPDFTIREIESTLVGDTALTVA